MSSTAKSYNFPKLSEAWVIFHGSNPEKKKLKVGYQSLVEKLHTIQFWLSKEGKQQGDNNLLACALWLVN